MTRKKPIGPKEAYDVLSDSVSWGKAFASYFGVIPSSKTYSEIDTKKTDSLIQERFASLVLQKFKYEQFRRKAGVRLNETIYLLSNQVIVHIEARSKSVHVLYSVPEDDFVHDLDQELRTLCKTYRGKEIFLAVSDMGISLKSVRLKKVDVALRENYNDDLISLHPKVVSLLAQKEKSELFLFHGAPGTGKSTYIRSLVYSQTKKVIFLPPNVAAKMDAPEIANLIINNPNSIVIIEDAEDLIISRNQESNSAISMLLNLTDGLLGYCLGIQFICTFNTTLNRIDPALLRKGRLSVLYEFTPLSSGKTNSLMKKLYGSVPDGLTSMTLADIYNFEAPNQEVISRTPIIGFSNRQLVNS